MRRHSVIEQGRLEHGKSTDNSESLVASRVESEYRRAFSRCACWEEVSR